MSAAKADTASGSRQRIDKWLWHARFFKTRTLAGEVAASGKVRLNGRHCSKASQTVAPGDELSFAQGSRVRAIRVEAIGARRGPASEAATLYTDLDPRADPSAANAPSPGPEPETEAKTAETAPSTPAPAPEKRPDRRARREITALRRSGP
ncbi:MAG: RNA-binding S4 domain-containing protein [Pseudomonadota bacterium]